MRRTAHLTFRLLGRLSAKIRRERSIWILGASSLALALGVAFLPWLFPAGIFRPISLVVASPIVIILFGLTVGLLGAQALRRTASDAAVVEDRGRGRKKRRSDGNPDRWTPARAPEEAHYDEHRTTGDEIDAVFELDPGEVRDLSARRRTARRRIRSIAVAVVAADENVGEETAAERIRAGTWTDDPRAAAFLGGRHLAPLRTRIRDWASGERFERWATHALEAVEARERGETPEPGERNVDKSKRTNFDTENNLEVSKR